MTFYDVNIGGSLYKFCDTPGSDDSRGSVQELTQDILFSQIDNMLSVHFFVFVKESNTEITDGAVGLARTLTLLANKFPDIKDQFTLIVTKGRKFDASKRFSALLKKVEQGKTHFADENVKRLLRIIATDKNRVIQFRRPTTDDQDLSYLKDAVEESLKTASSGQFLYNLSLTPAVELSIQNLITNCNTGLADFIQTELLTNVEYKVADELNEAKDRKTKTIQQCKDGFNLQAGIFRSVRTERDLTSILLDFNLNQNFTKNQYYLVLNTLQLYLKDKVREFFVPGTLKGALSSLVHKFEEWGSVEPKVANVEWLDTGKKRVGSNDSVDGFVFDRKRNKRWWIGGPLLTQKKTICATFKLANESIDLVEEIIGDEYLKDYKVGEHSNRRFEGRVDQESSYNPPKLWSDVARERKIDSN